jgi:hypothetical protein
MIDHMRIVQSQSFGVFRDHKNLENSNPSARGSPEIPNAAKDTTTSERFGNLTEKTLQKELSINQSILLGDSIGALVKVLSVGELSSQQSPDIIVGSYQTPSKQSERWKITSTHAIGIVLTTGAQSLLESHLLLGMPILTRVSTLISSLK